jgi:hydrogenase maturation protease
MTPKKWWVIGIGADFRGDDSFGLLVIDFLQKQSLAAGHNLKKCNDISKLYYDFRPELNLILVDAVKDATRAVGSEICWQITDRELPKDPTMTSSHSIGLADSLAMGVVLGNLPETVIFIGVVGYEFKLGSVCTPEVLEKVEEVGRRICTQYLL